MCRKSPTLEALATTSTSAGFDNSNDASLSRCSGSLCIGCVCIQRHQSIPLFLYFRVRASPPTAFHTIFDRSQEHRLIFSRLPLSLQENSVAQLQNSQAILDTTKEFLSSCPTDVYYIVHQPSILSSDLSTSAILSLQRALSAPAIKAKYMVSEARGLSGDVKEELLAHLQESCGETQSIDLDSPVLRAGALDGQISGIRGDGKKAIILQTMTELAGPSGSRQRIALLDKIGNSSPTYLLPIMLTKSQGRSQESDLSIIAAERSYTVIWTTTPPSAHGADVEPYEPEFQNPVHVEMKRDLGDRRSSAKTTSNNTNQRPLFEKYQFLTPGWFSFLYKHLSPEMFHGHFRVTNAVQVSSWVC
jgi:hypothetical protein